MSDQLINNVLYRTNIAMLAPARRHPSSASIEYGDNLSYLRPRSGRTRRRVSYNFSILSMSCSSFYGESAKWTYGRDQSVGQPTADVIVAVVVHLK